MQSETIIVPESFGCSPKEFPWQETFVVFLRNRLTVLTTAN